MHNLNSLNWSTISPCTQLIHVAKHHYVKIPWGVVSCVVDYLVFTYKYSQPQYSSLIFNFSLAERPCQSVNRNSPLYFTVFVFTSAFVIPPQIAVDKQVALYRGLTLSTVYSVRVAVNWQWRYIGVSGFYSIYMQEELVLCVCVCMCVYVCMYVCMCAAVSINHERSLRYSQPFSEFCLGLHNLFSL